MGAVLFGVIYRIRKHLVILIFPQIPPVTPKNAKNCFFPARSRFIGHNSKSMWPMNFK